jgi:primosomal protein N' (replication factor Y)
MGKQIQEKLFAEDETAEMPVARAENCRRVLVPMPVDKAYDYIMPEGMTLSPGDYVTVPLSGREIPGVVWGEAEGAVNPKKLKAIVARHDLPAMPDVHRKFIDWVSEYTMGAKGAVLKMSLSVPAALEPAAPVKGYQKKKIDDLIYKGLSPKQKKVIEVL